MGLSTYLRNQIQRAKISVTKLICEPYEHKEGLKDHVEELDARIDDLEENDRIRPIKPPTKCPTESGYYKNINNTCYYVEKQAMSYLDAQSNCKMIFGQNGHLFEPHSVEETKMVFNKITPIVGIVFFKI